MEPPKANSYISLMFALKQTPKEKDDIIPVPRRVQELCEQYLKLYQTLNEQVGDSQRAFLERLVQVPIPEHILLETYAMPHLFLRPKNTYPYKTKNANEASFPTTYIRASTITSTNEV